MSDCAEPRPADGPDGRDGEGHEACQRRCGVSDPVRVLIVDDDALVRAGLTMILSGADDVRVVGEAADGSEVPGAMNSSAEISAFDLPWPSSSATSRSRPLSCSSAVTALNNRVQVALLVHDAGLA
jgi:DNA-binding NarL/FixJ family response regulator